MHWFWIGFFVFVAIALAIDLGIGRAPKELTFRAALGKGSNVVTIGGLHGKVVDLNEETVTVEVDKGVRLRFDRSAIAREVASKTTTPAA